MNAVISLYDNFLIYYPNVFFPAISVVGILALIFIIKFILQLGKKVRIIFKEINNDLGQKRIKIKKKSLIKFILNFLRFIVKILVIIFTSINRFLTYLELQLKKIVKKIGKEILID